MISLDDKVQYLPYVGPGYAKRLEKLNIFTVEDLLYHLPSRYDDFSQITTIDQIKGGETVTVKVQILEANNLYTSSGYILQRATAIDNTGSIELMWFNQPYLIKNLKKDLQYFFQGKVEHQGKKLIIKSPKQGTGLGLQPIYPETQGISSKWLNNRVLHVLKTAEIQDPYFFQIALKDAFVYVHSPKNYDQVAKGRNRLAYDEMLLYSLKAKIRKEQWKDTVLGPKLEISKFRKQLKYFVEKLPFKLTNSQNKVVDEIYQDLAKNQPMNRLLQGDVGSGKTVVAALAMLATQLNGYQSILMAPTEILAMQHFETLKNMGLRVGIATGSAKDFKNFDILVGTHALLNLKLPNLGLVVIDEQHRFGVEQRSKLLQQSKTHMPHVLTMTATPIPRTVALAAFGDLDLSIIDELPIGRLPVKTWVVPEFKRENAYEWIKRQNSQTFIICPFIEPSETLMTVKSAKSEFEKIQKILPGKKIGLLHGKLKPREKLGILNSFRNEKLDILVATPVVEVGVDIPKATIMVIEDADRFGLAQLHQLRGRVGRNKLQSYCLLFANDNWHRLKILEKTNSGMVLAQEDLRYRGPGELFGTAQSGKFIAKVATFDPEIVTKSCVDSSEIYKNLDKYPILKKKLEKSKMLGVLPN